MNRALPVLLVAAALSSPGAPAQDRLPRWKIDPHTGNDPELIAKAGYVSLGPFEFGDDGARGALTTRIETVLQPARILWVETAHFKIGSSLPAVATPSGREDRLRVREELTRLSGKLPKVRPTARRLTPWLRLHLIAQRMEDLYAEFQNWAGVIDWDFPKGASEITYGPGGEYMGEGPYLGQKGKFLVLVLDNRDHYSRYLNTYVGRDSEMGQRWNFLTSGSMLYAVNTEIADRRFADDTALHGHLVFHVSRNLLDGFRFYSFDLPAWFTDGLAHWFERRVSKRWNSVPDSHWTMVETRSAWEWETLAPELSGGEFAPFGEVQTWNHVDDFSFQDHVLNWSRVDFLMWHGKKKFADFLGRLTHRNPGDVSARTRQALQSVYGWSVDDFDSAWLEWLRR